MLVTKCWLQKLTFVASVFLDDVVVIQALFVRLLHFLLNYFTICVDNTARCFM